jgi:adenylate cyclase
MDLNPLDPAFFHHLLAAAFAHLFAGRPAEALALAQRSLALYADWDTTFHVLTVCFIQVGRHAEAHAAVDRFAALLPDATISRLRQTLRLRKQEHLEMILDGLSEAGLPAFRLTVDFR